MSLNTSGALLEGVRLAPSSNVYVYPPRNFVLPASQASFNTTTTRAEYCLVVTGQKAGLSGMGIADSNLAFLWTRNDQVFRFDYDNAARRWFPAPGGTPTKLGAISNSPRLVAPPIKVAALSTSPYQVYLGLPRIASLIVSPVNDSSSFGNPPAGTVEISIATGELNFGLSDLSNPAYQGIQVFVSRQSFLNRSSNKGAIGVLPKAGTYEMFLNPIPGPGQTPLVRIGFRSYIAATQYPLESSMPAPLFGAANYAADTGKILFGDAPLLPEETAYYDGVVMGKASLTRINVGTITASSGNALVGVVPAFVGEVDSSRYFFYVDDFPTAGKTWYLLTAFVDSIPSTFDSGAVFVQKSNGAAYISSADSILLAGRTLRCVDGYLPIDNGVTFQVFRSGVNGSGNELVPDFVEIYRLKDQILVDGIQGSPYIMLPFKPLQDSILSFKVEAGSGGGGTFVGQLSDATSPTTSGIGYLLQLDNGRISFTNRKKTTKQFRKPVAAIKLDDGSIVEKGFEAKIDGVQAVPDADFDFNSTTGTVDFLEPVGELDPGDVYGMNGSITLPDSFQATSHVFSATDAGSFLFVHSGPNAGFRKILQVAGPKLVKVDGSFVSAGPVTLDLRKTYEVIADRFWITLSPPMKKFLLEEAPSTSGTFVKVPESQFKVIPQVGQINLSSLTNPGTVFRATYISLDSTDDGATSTPTNRIEFAPSKVRLDPATYVVGTNTIKFNAAGKTVVPEAGIVVTVDGVRLESDKVQFVAPDSAVIGVNLKSEEVVVDYSVAEQIGGSKTMNLTHTPLDVDYPSFSAGSSSASLNGDLTQYFKSGSALFLGEADVLIVQSSSYDSTSDVTNVVFTTEIVNDFVGDFMVCAPLEFLQLTGPANPVPDSSNLLSVPGVVSVRPGTVVTMDGDPYSVISVSYNSATDRTSLTLATGAYRNYVTPSVLASKTPVLKAGSDFSTSRPADTRAPFTLFRDGPEPRTLFPDSDYTLSDGGLMALTSPVSFGDSLYATYVARVSKRAETKFEFNYAYLIAPNDLNGLAGQKLTASFNMYSPDSFFYRVETVETYIPEVSEAIQQGSGQVPSGPVTSGAVTLKNKDFGVPSLFFDEQRYHNLDYVDMVLLKFYNDLVNLYEVVLSNMDGRVVGGTSGLFRYDGNFNNPPRAKYSDVTNDIDDRVKIYDDIQITSVIPLAFTATPVYARMWQSNSLSRIFPTVSRVNAGINDKTGVADAGSLIGNLGITNITGVATITTAPSISGFVSILSGSQLEIQKNGDSTNKLPAFTSGQKLNVYKEDGTPAGTTTISAITGDGPYYLHVAPSVTLSRGSVVTNVADTSISSNKIYIPNTDIAVDVNSGNLGNMSDATLIAVNFQRPVFGPAITSTTVTYQSLGTGPKKVPALDGSELQDDGLVSIPPLHRRSELDILQDEFNLLSNSTSFGQGAVLADLVSVTGALLPPVVAGDLVKFIGGPNDGQERTVLTVASPALFIVSAPFTSPSATEYGIEKTAALSGGYVAILNELTDVLNDNVAAAPVAPALIGKINSEISAISDVCLNLGKVVTSGTGTVAGVTLTDPLASFPQPIASYVFVQHGPNSGLYKVAAATSTVLTVSTDSPFQGFPVAGPTSYVLFSLYSFLSDSGPKFVAEAYRKAVAFYGSTVMWKASVSQSGAQARLDEVTQRITDLGDLVDKAQKVLKTGDSLYGKRFIWIQQRTDRKDGFLIKATRAEASRAEASVKLVQDQQKVLALSAL